MARTAGVDAVLISFYTWNDALKNNAHNTQYAESAERLAAKCKQLGVRHYIKKRADKGDYLANCRQKPTFIAEAMRHLHAPVLWVDADAVLRRDPRGALRADVDFMAGEMPPTRDRRWHVGTLFFNYTAAAEMLMLLWAEALDNFTSDEAALERMRVEGKWRGRYAKLPRSYHWCSGKYWLHKDNKHIRDETVILHYLSTSESKAKALAEARARTNGKHPPRL